MNEKRQRIRWARKKRSRRSKNSNECESYNIEDKRRRTW